MAADTMTRATTDVELKDKDKAQMKNGLGKSGYDSDQQSTPNHIAVSTIVGMKGCLQYKSKGFNIKNAVKYVCKNKYVLLNRST